MLKVTFFVYNLGGYSGAALQALNLAKHLPYSITILNTGEAYTDENPAHISIVNLPKSPVSRFASILFRLVFFRPNLIHFHGQFLVAMGLAKCLGITYILKTTLLGDDDFDSIKKKRFSEIRLWLSRQSKHNIVLSEQLKLANSKYYPTQKIHTISNGTLIPDHAPKFSDKNNHFYFCGVISERKNTLKAIQIFHQHYSDLPDSHLYLVGPISNYELNRDFDAEYISKCFSYAKDHDLNQKVTFTGLLPQADVKTLAAKCKALLFFSNFEGMPNVVIEAMAQNCVPIISSMHGVGYELTENGAGFVIEDFSAPTIEIIDSLIQNSTPYRQATSKYSLKATAESIGALYELATH